MRAPRKALFIALILLVAFLQSPLAIIPHAQCAEGDYTGESWPIAGAIAGYGLTTDGNFIWVADDTANAVYKYTMEGVYTDTVWDTGSNDRPRGMTTDGSNIWMADCDDERVYKYTMNGAPVTSFLLTAGNSVSTGVTTDGNFIWVTDSDDYLYKYTMAGAYLGKVSLLPHIPNPYGPYTDGTNIWVVEYGADIVYKLDMDGAFTGYNWSVAVEANNPTGLGCNGTYFWVLDVADDEVYLYEGPTFTPPTSIENKGIVPSDSTVDDEQWFFLNASIEVLTNSSTFLFNRIDIDPDGLNMSCSYTNGTGFSEENDPNNYLQLDAAVSVKTDLNNTFVRVDYYLRIHSNVTKDGVYNVTVYSTASVDLSDSDNYTSVFTLTIRTPSAPTLLFGAGFNASSPYVELHWTHDLLIFTIFEVQNSSNGADWSYLGQNATAAQYNDSQVVNGTARYYKVRVCRSWGGGWKNSSFSDSNFETVYFVEAAAAGDTYITGSIGIFLIVLIIIVPIVFYKVKAK